MLLTIGGEYRIPMSDEDLDRVRDMLEECASDGGGFWLSGNLAVETEDDTFEADPGLGHQRLWVHANQLVHLTYDRPLDEDGGPLPDNVVRFGPR